MGDNWMVPFIKTVASQDDPAAVAKDFLFDPIRFAQTAADVEFLHTIESFKAKAICQVVVTLKRLFALQADLVMNDDDHVVFVVSLDKAATLSFLFNQRAPARWVDVTLLQPSTRAMMLKLQFINVRVIESKRFMRYLVFRAEIDRWHTLVQNVTELDLG